MPNSFSSLSELYSKLSTKPKIKKPEKIITVKSLGLELNENKIICINAMSASGKSSTTHVVGGELLKQGYSVLHFNLETESSTDLLGYLSNLSQKRKRDLSNPNSVIDVSSIIAKYNEKLKISSYSALDPKINNFSLDKVFDLFDECVNSEFLPDVVIIDDIRNLDFDIERLGTPRAALQAVLHQLYYYFRRRRVCLVISASLTRTGDLSFDFPQEKIQHIKSEINENRDVAVVDLFTKKPLFSFTVESNTLK